MDRNDRDEVAIDQYFLDLGEGHLITSYDIFKARIAYEVTEGQSLGKIIEHFWQASRSASMISSINRFATHDTTKAANKLMSRKMTGVYDLFSSNMNDATGEDLERIMALHVRLQTVPTQKFMTSWTAKALGQMDELSAAWFKSNFDHFTKLGMYPEDHFITAWWGLTENRIAEFDTGDLFRILYKMATFDFLRTHDYSHVYKETPSPCRHIAEQVFSIIEPQALRLFPEVMNNQVFFAGLWFGKDFVHHRPVAGDDDAHASAFENLVAQSIGATSITVNYDGIRVPVTGHRVDLKLYHAGKSYGCEVDGISHFNRIAGATPHDNAVIYNASTRFHSWLTSHYLSDINIIRVPYFLFDTEVKGLPWEKTLSRISRKDGHSIYAWHGGSITRDLQKDENAHLFRGCDL